MHASVTVRQRWVGLLVIVLAAAAAVAVATLAGIPGRAGSLVVAGCAGGLGLVVASRLLARGRPGALALEVPVLLLLLSTLVLRQRSVEDIAYDPLDPAAQLRVASLGMALLLGVLALLNGRSREVRMGAPIRLYALYVLVVFAAAPLSVAPALSAFRGVELLASLVVLGGAAARLGRAALPRIESVLYLFLVALVASVWVGVALVPEQAVEGFLNTRVPIKSQIRGVLPSISSNGVGSLGVLLAIWSLVRARDRRPGMPGRGMLLMLAGVGVATLVAAQYRTGYIALATAVIILLAVRRRVSLAALLLLAGVTAVTWFPSLLGDAQPYVLRGQTPQQAAELSSRVDWWRAAVPVWRESPLFGRGLLTASRFEVLAPLGQGATGGIHSTWVEALVGTGLLGIAFLAASLLAALAGAVRWVRGNPLSLLLLVVIAIRSLTGQAIESLGFLALVYLWTALSVAQPVPDPRASGDAR